VKRENDEPTGETRNCSRDGMRVRSGSQQTETLEEASSHTSNGLMRTDVSVEQEEEDGERKIDRESFDEGDKEVGD
jgi:hypothetical protein